MTLPLHEKDLNAMGPSSSHSLTVKPGFKTDTLGAKLSKTAPLKSPSVGVTGKLSAPSDMGATAAVNPDPSPAHPPAGPTHTHLQTHLLSVEDMLKHVKQNKLTEGRPLKPQPQRLSTSAGNVCLVGENSGRIKWIQPSGPRRTGEGTEDEEQGIIAAESTATGGAMVRITLLAAGFVIGPSGTSVREMSKQTGADMKSWTEKPDNKSASSRPTRSFVIEGKKRAVVLALDIMCDAVDRYKDLCEGRYCGQFVARIQKVRGVEFSYQPPPRNIVPYAAALKGQHPRLSRAEVAPGGVPAAAQAMMMPGVAYPSVQPCSVGNSLSTQSNDSCSDMSDDRPHTVPDDKGQLHSKAQVMQSYLSAQEPTTARPPSKPHTTGSIAPPPAAYDIHMTNYSNSPTPNDHVTASDTASKHGSAKIPSRAYTTPPPSQGGEAPPHFSRAGFSPVASYSNTDRAHTPAAARNPGQLVQVKGNVWLPWAVVQQAGGDAELALHLAAQEKPHTKSHDSIDSSPTAGKAWNPAGKAAWTSASTNSKPSHDNPWQDMGPKENDSCSNSTRSNSRGADHAAYAPWAFSSQQFGNDDTTAGAGHYPWQYDNAEMQSHFSSAMSLKPDNAATCNGGPSKFDPTIQPSGRYAYLPQDLGVPQTASETTASKQGNGSYGFRSPTASLPIMGNSNSFVSPQCVMDNSSSLFSYTVATPEQTVHSRPAPLFTTPDTHPTQGWGAPHLLNPPCTFNPAAFYPELNPSAAHLHMGQASGVAGFPSMHDPFMAGVGAGAGGYPGRPWQEGKTQQALSQFGASPDAHKPHSNMAAGMGSNTNSTDNGHSGAACLPWIQGSHPLLGNF